MARPTRSAASRSSVRSSPPNTRGGVAHATSTPVTSPSASSGTPTSAPPSLAGSSRESIASRVSATVFANSSPPEISSGVDAPTLSRSLLVGEIDRGGVGVQHAAHLSHELTEDVVERPIRKRCIHQRLQAAHEVRHALGLGARRLLP